MIMVFYANTCRPCLCVVATGFEICFVANQTWCCPDSLFKPSNMSQMNIQGEPIPAVIAQPVPLNYLIISDE